MKYVIIKDTHPFYRSPTDNITWVLDTFKMFPAGTVINNGSRKTDMILFWESGHEKAVPYANVAEVKKSDNSHAHSSNASGARTVPIHAISVMAHPPISVHNAVIPRSALATPGVPQQVYLPPGAGDYTQTGPKSTESQSEKTQKESAPDSEAKKFLWMPRKFGIPVAIVGVSLLAFGAYKFFTRAKA